MKPVDQTKFGQEGNCFCACLASLLEVPIEQVDFKCWEDDWYREAQGVLLPFGYRYLEFTADRVMAYSAPDTLCILTGMSRRGRNHSVVGRLKGAVAHGIHDPHPSRDYFAVQASDIGFLIPIDPARTRRAVSLASLAADIAARVPAMAQDCALNNAEMIEGLIRAEIDRCQR